MTDPRKVLSQTLPTEEPLVGVIMGSRSDWATMQHCAETLE